MDNEKIRVGIVGLGDTGIIHANSYMHNPHVRIVGVCDVDPDKVNLFLRGPWKWPVWWQNTPEYECFYHPVYDIRKVFRDWQQMSQDKDIDAVSVCLPTIFHANVAINMLNSGKHVLLEKPMAGSTEECDKIIEAASKTARILMVAHMWRFHPEVKFVRNVVKSGVIGEIVKTKSYAVYVRSTPSGWFLDKNMAVGGPLLDIGVHAIDTVRYLIGSPEPKRIYAKVSRAYGNYNVDDTGIVLIEFSNGTVSIVETGQNHPYADGLEASTQLFGTKGYGRVFPTEFQFKIEDEWGVFKPDIQYPHINPSMFQGEINHFIDSVLSGNEPLTNGYEAKQAIKVVEAAYRSADEKRVIDLD